MTNRLFLFFSSAFILGACSYALETHTQDIKIETPGARGSVCYTYVKGLRYRVHPPQTINIENTRADLVVDCLAPGNRRKKVIIEPHLAEYFALNALNGGAGAIWDSASGAMYKYPDVIEIDFSAAALKPELMPAQNAPDIKQPEEYYLEEFRPGHPLMNDDKGQPTYKLQRRQTGGGYSDATSYVDDGFSLETTNNTAGGKADLDINSLINKINPAPSAAEQTESTYNPPIDVYTVEQSDSGFVAVEEASPVYGPEPVTTAAPSESGQPTNLLSDGQ